MTHERDSARADRRPTDAADAGPTDVGGPPMKRRITFKPRRHRNGRRRLGWIGVLGTLLALWAAGLFLFVERIPRAVEAPMEATDAIVVLTGGSDRLQEGLRLIAGRQAEKLFISGVHDGIDLTELLRSVASAPEMMPAPEQIDCCIALGHRAADTEGNARETAAWMAAQNFRSLRLVTADYHMPRSLIEFRRVMPDLIIRSHPVFPPQINREAWWRSPGTALLMLKEYNKCLVAYLRSLFIAPSKPAGAR